MGLKPPKLTFLKTTPELEDIHSFYFSYDDGFSWKPGQFVTVILPGIKGFKANKHAFSISSAPSEGHVRITTHIPANEPSQYKQALQSLQPGDQVTVHGPHGKFTLDRSQSSALLIAGGIGVTPCRSMLLESTGDKDQKPLTLVYIQRESQFVFVSELETAAQDENTEVLFVNDDADLPGILDKHAGADTDCYVSGPPKMVSAVADQLAEKGVNKKRLHRDSFTGY